MASSAPVREWTKEEVSSHRSASDCWLIVSGRVYDVTDFLARHPAGARIIQLHGGRDCTSAFLDVHSESYLTQFLPPSAFKGVLAGSGVKSAPAKPFVGRYWQPDEVLSVKRTVFQPEHEEYRKQFRAFITKHVHPVYAKWEQQGQPDISVLRELVKEGFYLRFAIPKQFGGLGLTDWRYSAVVTEELENADVGSFFLNLGNDMVLSYFTKSATPEQQARWLPKIVKEGSVIAIAMSEPELGSDLATLRTTAKRSADGQTYELTGRKMWISAGATADLAVISAVTDASKGARGISLFVVEKDTAGFESAKRFAKAGKHASDTCLLTLDKVVVPAANLLGKEGEGFKYMMSNLSKERLSIAIGSVAAARRALALTLNYIHGRQMFGGVTADLQSVQQKCAQMRLDIQVATTFVDQCITAQAENSLSADTASMAKVLATELASRVADQCLQLYGGYGYLKQNPVAKIWADQRVTRIYGGANEVLLEVAGKGLGFRPQRMHRSKL